MRTDLKMMRDYSSKDINRYIHDWQFWQNRAFNFVFEFEFNGSHTKRGIRKKRSICLRYLKIKKEIIALKIIKNNIRNLIELKFFLTLQFL